MPFLPFCRAAGEGVGAAGIVAKMREWERDFGILAGHYLPHDASTRDKGSGLTYRAQIVAGGIPDRLITRVQRTTDPWIGINEVRKRLPKDWEFCSIHVTQKSAGDEIEFVSKRSYAAPKSQG